MIRFIRTPNKALPNRNVFACGMSGSGKTTFLQERLAAEIKDTPKVHVMAWDPDEDHKLQRYRSWRVFAEAAVVAIGTGKVFRGALSLDPTPAAFARFCNLVAQLCSCERPMIVLVEELASVQLSSGKAPQEWGWLSRNGRKYGLRLLTATQRPAEIDKTVFSQSPYKWVGYTDNISDAKSAAATIGVSVDDIQALAWSVKGKSKTIHWYWKTPEGGPATRGDRTFRLP